MKGFVLFLSLFLVAGCAMQSHDLVWESDDPFYRSEQEDGTFGQKTALDRAAQLDPATGKVQYSQSFLDDPPKKIAILPFENLEGGNFRLNWIPVTARDEKEEDDWSWTYANRLRKFFFAYMSLREFELLSLMETDTILKELEINNSEQLYNTDARDLARVLGVDAVIYGKMTKYSAKYLFLYTQVAVGLSVKCVSGKDGQDLFIASEVRRDNKFRMAFSPIDMIATSLQNTFNVRKLHLARAADEACRELVASIPVVEKLVKEKESYWKDYVASNSDIQAIKEKIAIANSGGAVLVAEGANEEPRVADEDSGAIIAIKPDEDTLEEVTEGVQVAHANGAGRSTESAWELDTLPRDSVLDKALESGDAGMAAVDDITGGDNFTYLASTPGLIADDGQEEVMEIARVDVVYNTVEGDTLEIDASDIVYSNTGVVADNPADEADSLDDDGLFEMKDMLDDEVIEKSLSDFIYSSKNDPVSPNSAS